MRPRWLEVALKEMADGIFEVPGPNANPRIVEYHRHTSLMATSDEVPWCSAFACWCMEECDIESTRSAAARSWLKWGQKIDEPRVGCIVVLKRGKNPAQGHVGFYMGPSASRSPGVGVPRIDVLGGNQRDKVCIVSFGTDDVLGYRWPEEG